ncbi:MBL fold metallo-hydrolase [Patescibacteria group bacterium]|nr:MBL fold metallo-hydrolase [Patescibacteria group bacterium]
MNSKTFKLTFHGGAGSVTGANFLLEGEDVKILVDCGLFQGGEFDEEKNREPFAYTPKSIDILMVTHAHTDHIGRIPKLVKEGFEGIIYSTPGTKELSEAMLQDSVGVFESDKRQHGTKPLYGREDVDRTMSLWKTVPYHTTTSLQGGLQFNFKDAGHILGSSIIELTQKGGNRKIVFSGDLGNSPSALLRDTEFIDDATYMIMESVYGDRKHESVAERTAILEDIIENTINKGGALLIPAFSIERTQTLLYEINNLVENGRIPKVPVFLDSPLAIKITAIYKKRIKNFKNEVQEEIQSGDDIFDFPNLKLTKTADESRKIEQIPNPKIIIAGSGMSSGGRIQFHEKKHLSDPKSTLLLVGYQSVGSIGRRIQDGAKEVTIKNEVIPIRAKIVNISGYSAHRDTDGLFDFVSHSSRTLEQVFVAMGEEKSALHMVQRIRDYLSVQAISPKQGQQFDIAL